MLLRRMRRTRHHHTAFSPWHHDLRTSIWHGGTTFLGTSAIRNPQRRREHHREIDFRAFEFLCISSADHSSTRFTTLGTSLSFELLIAQARLDNSDVPKRVAEVVIRNYIKALRTTFSPQ
jgi:hypothetical protein